MAAADDLNQINYDLLKEWKDNMDALKPILLENSGYSQVQKQYTYDEAKQKLLSAEPFGAPTNDGSKRAGTLQKEIDVLSGYTNKFDPKKPDQSVEIRTGGLDGKYTLADLQKQIDQRNSELDTRVKNNLTYTAYERSPEAQAQLDAQKKLQDQQDQIALAYGDRQLKALNGELPVSAALTKKKADDWQQFKESQSRAGNSIMGDTPESAVAKGTAASEALRNFQTNYGLLEDNERNGVLTSGLNSFETSRSGVPAPVPVVPDSSGFIQSSLGAQQPYQFQQQMQFNQNQLQASLNQNNLNRQYGLYSGLLGAAGMAGGAYLGR